MRAVDEQLAQFRAALCALHVFNLVVRPNPALANRGVDEATTNRWKTMAVLPWP